MWMEPVQNFHKSCCENPILFANSVFKKYCATSNKSLRDSDDKLSTYKIYHPLPPNNFGVYPELSKNNFYTAIGKNYLNEIQQCFKPYNTVFEHQPLECSRDAINMRLKKQRSEKKPVPEEKKDALYYEKRKRNNWAAKKSRDARKLREDQIAFKASVLENENALLRTQVIALREEASFLRHLLMEEKKRN